MGMDNNLRNQLNKTGVNAIGILTEILSINNKYWTGDLIRSLKYDVVRTGEDTYDIRLSANDYLKYVDQQSPSFPKPVRPRLVGGPPIDALKQLEDKLFEDDYYLIQKSVQDDIEDRLRNDGFSVITRLKST